MNDEIKNKILDLKNELNLINNTNDFLICDKNNSGLHIAVSRDYTYFDTYISKIVERIEEEIDYWEDKIKDNEK